MKQNYKNISLKLLAFLILLIILGLPVNNQLSFLIFVFFVPIIIFSKIKIEINLFKILFLLFLFFLINFLIPTIKINEGHNVVVLNNYSEKFYKEYLPLKVYNYFEDEFLFYKNNSTCDENTDRCWKKFNPFKKFDNSIPIDNIYATSSDWSFNKGNYSRIVKDINFENIKTLRLGQINNLYFNFFWLNKYDLVRENMPFFVMYEIPKILVSSSLCWKGNVFWEDKKNFFLHYYHKSNSCRKIYSDDVGKKIYGVSFGSSTSIDELKWLYGKEFINKNDNFDHFLDKNSLIIKLKKSNKILIYNFLDIFNKIMFVFIFYLLFFNLKKTIYLLSFIYSALFFILLYYIDQDLLNGFDIYTGGNDGLLYMSYANLMFEHLKNLNFYEYFRGVENVFYFPSSIRYFLPINKIFFGETIYGYIFFLYLFTIVLFYILSELLGITWSIVISALVFLTRLFEGYALSSFTLLKHVNAGDAEPLAIFFILLSLLIFIKSLNKQTIEKNYFNLFLFGFFIFLSISLRPNYLPTGCLLILSFIIYSFFYSYNFRIILFPIIGFSFLVLLPLHNIYYGDSFVLLSSGSHHNTHAPISAYFYSLIDLLNLNLSQSANIDIISNQLNRWIQPKEIHYMITFIFLFITFFLHKRFVIRTIILLALSQHLVLLIYEPTNRYAYLAWILTIIVSFYFVRNNYKRILLFNRN